MSCDCTQSETLAAKLRLEPASEKALPRAGPLLLDAYRVGVPQGEGLQCLSIDGSALNEGIRKQLAPSDVASRA
jgi:hypothetical protein